MSDSTKRRNPASNATTIGIGPSQGWFKSHRSPEAMELIAANPKAFILAYVIGFRAQWSDRFNRHDLAPGEALLGDFKNMGMTEQQYRTAKDHLTKWKFATFRTTNKGTVGKLIDSRLFEVLLSHGNGQKNTPSTSGQRASNGRVTTTDELVEPEEHEEQKKSGNSRSSIKRNF